MPSAVTAHVITYLKELCVLQKSCSLVPMSHIALLTVRNIPLICKSGALNVSSLSNDCYKAGTNWPIHTTMAPMLFCDTAAICVTLVPAEFQSCKCNNGKKVSYCAVRASSSFFFFQSSIA